MGGPGSAYDSAFVDLLYPVFNDFAGYVSLIAYVNKCNLDCPFCFSHDIVTAIPDTTLANKIDDIFSSTKLLHGFIISGGEPLLHQPFLIDYVSNFKLNHPNVKIALDTNATIKLDDDLLSMVDKFNISIKPRNWMTVAEHNMFSSNIVSIAKTKDIEFRVVLSYHSCQDGILESFGDVLTMYHCRKGVSFRLSNAKWMGVNSHKQYFDVIPQKEYDGIVLNYRNYSGIVID